MNIFKWLGKKKEAALEPPPLGSESTRRQNWRPRYDRFRDMRDDPQIRLGLATIKAPIIGANWNIECKDPIIQAWITDEISVLWRSMTRKCLCSVEYGHADMEKIFKIGGDRRYHLGRLDDFEPYYVRFFKEESGDLAGLSYMGQPTLGPEKFIHMAVDEEYGDPHGRSRLIPAEDDWKQGKEIRKDWAEYLRKKANPPTIGRAPGDKRLNPADSKEYSPIDAVDKGIRDLNSGGRVVFSDERDAKGEYRYNISYLLDDKRNAEFLSAINFTETMKLRALLVPERTVTQDQGTGSFAMADAHTETFLRSEEELLAEYIAVVQGVIDQLVLINWGASAPRAFIRTKPLSRDVENLIRTIFQGLATSSPDTFIRILDLVRLCDSYDIPTVKDAAKNLLAIQSAPLPTPTAAGPGGVANFRRADLARKTDPGSGIQADQERIFNVGFAGGAEFFNGLKRRLADQAKSGSAKMTDADARALATTIQGPMLLADLAARARVVRALPADVKLRRSTGAGKADLAQGDAAEGDAIKLMDDPAQVLGSFSPEFAKSTVDYLLAKQAMTIDDFNKLADYYQRQAFSIAGDFTADFNGKVRDALAQTMAAGGTQADFKSAVDNLFDAEGLTQLSPGRIENIYRTNVGQAYADGQWKELQSPEVRDAFPAYTYHTFEDAAVRPNHAEMDGRTYLATDPIWLTWRPKNGYQCRCWLEPISRQEFDSGAVQLTEGYPVALPDLGWRGPKTAPTPV